MKLEHGIIVFVAFLVFVVLGLIAAFPDETPSTSQLERINRQALMAKESQDPDKVERNRIIVQEKLQKMATNQLRVHISNVDIEPYFPFRDAAGIEPFDEESFTIPTCDIIPHIPMHLKAIRNSEMFSMFSKKYGGYPMEMFIQDERMYRSIVHYSFVVKSNDENKTASMWVHLNSCSNETSVPYNLSCRDLTTDKLMHTRTLNEIVDSINDDEFCSITFPQWKQKLYDYGQVISNKMKIHEEKLDAIKDDPTFEKVMAFQNEMERLGLLGNMAGKAIMNGLDDSELRNLKEEYVAKFGKIPEDLLALIER